MSLGIFFFGGGVFCLGHLIPGNFGVFGVNIKWTTHHSCRLDMFVCLVLLHLTLCRTIFVQIVQKLFMQGLNAYQCFYCFEIANFPGFLQVGENLT